MNLCDDYDSKLALSIEKATRYLKPADQSSSPRSSIVSSTSIDARLKLPKIDLPKFSGSYSQWTSFADLFDGAVHSNSTLSKAQKLFYLKGLLTGDAARLVASLTNTDANYDVAREMLKERYANLRAIVREHISYIVNAAPVTKQDPIALRNLWQCVDEHRRGLEALGQNTTEMDHFTVHLLTEKMDCESRRQWEIAHPGTDVLTYEQLSTFLSTRCRALEASQSKTTKVIDFGQGQNNKKRGQSFTVSQSQTNECPKCTQLHGVYACEAFKNLSVDERRKFVQEKRLCFNCLKQNHQVRDCPTHKKCKMCNKTHNTLLHDGKASATSAITQASANIQVTHVKQVSSQVTKTRINSNYQVILQTAIINILDKTGKPTACRALLDSGSQINLITNACRAKLGLSVINTDSSFTVAGTGQIIPCGKSQIQLQMNDSVITTPALVVKGNLTLPLPSISFAKPVNIPHITLADPDFNISSKIDLLIGAQLYEALRTGETIQRDNLYFTNTVFGYVVSGASPNNNDNVPIVNHIMSQDDCLQKFWETEEIPTSKESNWSVEEAQCSKHYDETTIRDESGRYIVDMPFIKPKPILGDSFTQATYRLNKHRFTDTGTRKTITTKSKSKRTI